MSSSSSISSCQTAPVWTDYDVSILFNSPQKTGRCIRGLSRSTDTPSLSHDSECDGADTNAPSSSLAAAAGASAGTSHHSDTFILTNQHTWFELVCTSLSRYYPVFLYGPTGSGKSAGIRHIARTFNIPLYELNGHSRLDFPDLVGGWHLQQQTMVWHDGPLTSAMRTGGIFLLNEVSYCDPAVLAGLNTILDNACLAIPETGEQLTPHAEFHFIVTDNSNGSGDESGLYTGVLRQNAAFLNRFIHVFAPYIGEQAESAILSKKFPSFPKEIIDKMVAFAGEVRTSEDLNFPVSFRDLSRWVDLSMAYERLRSRNVSPVMYAAAPAFLNRASSSQREALQGLLDRIF